MPEIVLTHVTKRWDKFYAVDDLNLVIDDNAFVTLLGPSGCGKTTTLRMIAGLETPTSGRITIGGRVVYDSEAGINIPPNKRKVGFLFQNYALWPNMTVYQNISFGLSNIKEELPKFDPDASRAATLLRVLQKPDDVVKTIVECVDKKGKLDVNKAQIKLIDRYEISIYAAKTLMSYKLHESMEPGTVAQARRPELEAALKSARDKAAAAGCTLNDRFEYEKDGKPVTAGGDRPVRAPRGPDREDRHVHGPLSLRAVRRPAAARGHRPDAGSGADGAVHGRAAEQSGREAAP